jgi:anaerobic magnesium-protoporphyrin IX monomethyl ester cyclase
MAVLLLSGAGPAFKYWSDLTGSLFEPDTVSGGLDGLAVADLSRLTYPDARGEPRPLLRRKRGRVLYLVSYVLESILFNNDIEYTHLPLQHVWDDLAPPVDRGTGATDPEAVLLSTTFICNQGALAQAIGWVADHYPGVPLVVGGQFSNLKYLQVLRDYPAVDYVVRGDGEEAIPGVVAVIRGRRTPESVPNLVYRGDGSPKINPIRYIDLDAYPAAAFPGPRSIVPYESMRGCPFNCRFCSYPAASPTWRFKSADKIYRDWLWYAEHNAVDHVQALDSTFTVPKPRLRELLPMLRGAPLTWEAYTRANAIHAPEIADSLTAAHCTKLSIGFESMSPNTLSYMHKQVRPEQNRTAHEILRDRDIQYRVSYMAGYPGETPEDYRMTDEFIANEFVGYFMLSVFSFSDETMPVWEDAERFELDVADMDDPDAAWQHVGMDVETARGLRDATISKARWGSEDAVWLLWQADYETPLIPGTARKQALRHEKLVERLGMLPVDFSSAAERARRSRQILAELSRAGIAVADRHDQLAAQTQ